LRVAFAFFAESVDMTTAGRLTVGGVGVNLIEAPWFPTALVALYFVCRLEAVAAECDVEHLLRFEVVDADGQQVSPASEMTWQPDRSILSRGRLPSITAVQPLSLHFPAPGAYIMHILVSGIELGVVPFYVEHARPGPS
jgi:hypothetical protein